MQGKASIVMTCYNKAEYIVDMFDSIIAQLWGNIELIIVNDGSTDGTRDIITVYEPKLRARGFEVLIVDQENKGVCAATKAGLERITGDYVCLVDADDELNPEYISTMAGWLEQNKDCDYCVCGSCGYTGRGDKKIFKPDWAYGLHADSAYILEKYIFHLIMPTVWVYMLRSEYLDKCNIVNTYYTQTKCDQESAYIVPILAFGGRYKYFPQPLYHHNIQYQIDKKIYRVGQFERLKHHWLEHDRLCKIAIERLPDNVAGKDQKQKLAGISSIAAYIFIYRHTIRSVNIKKHADEIFLFLLNHINKFFTLDEPITAMQCQGKGEMLIRIVTDMITGQRSASSGTRKPPGRIIGYGAMGERAENYLLDLKDTPYEPTELWDIRGDGAVVRKPDFASLGKTDTLLLFPIGHVLYEVDEKIKGSGCVVMNMGDVAACMAPSLFPQLLLKI